MNIKIKRGEVCNLYLALRSLNDIGYNKIFLFYVHRNLSLLEDEFNDIFALEQTTLPSGEFLEFTEKRTKLLESNVMRDDSGNMYVDNDGNYLFEPDMVTKFNNELDKLKIEYSTCIKENDSHTNDVNSVLETEVIIKIEPIPFRYIPNDIKEQYWEYYKLLILESDESIISKYK